MTNKLSVCRQSKNTFGKLVLNTIQCFRISFILFVTPSLSSMLSLYLGRQGTLWLFFKHWLCQHSNYRAMQKIVILGDEVSAVVSFSLSCTLLLAFFLRTLLTSGQQHPKHWSNPVESTPQTLLSKHFLTWPKMNCNVYSIISHRVASQWLFPPGVGTKGKA